MVTSRTDIDPINVFTEDDQNFVKLTTLASGGYVATWISDGEFGQGHSLVSQVYSEDGQRIGAPSYLQSTTVQSNDYYSVVGLNDGSYAVTWIEFATVLTRVFNADGSPASDVQAIETTTSTVFGTSTQLLPDGTYLVTYDARDSINGDWDIMAQRVNG